MALTIPKRLEPLAVSLFALPAPERNDVLEAMKEVPKGSNITAYEQKVKAAFPQYERDEVKSVSFILSLYAIKDEDDESTPLARELTKALQNINHDVVKDALENEPEKFEEFEEFLVKALDAQETLGIGAKAYRLMFQHERMFIESEIFSDLRTVFSQKHPEALPVAAVITHSLKIHVHLQNGSEDLYVAMDHVDLEQLQRTVERALKKHKSLTEMVGRLKIPVVDFGGDEE